MTLAETHLPDFDKGEIAYAMLQFLETYIKDRDHKIKEGFEDGIHEALWESLEYLQVEAV